MLSCCRRPQRRSGTDFSIVTTITNAFYSTKHPCILRCNYISFKSVFLNLAKKIDAMTSALKVVKNVGPKLVPFFKTVVIYFITFIPYDKPSLLGTVLKCLPIVSLMLFILLHGMSFDDEHQYSRRILTGLFFCCIGDAFLIWHNYFDVGMLAFAVGHWYYVLAFGSTPLKLPLGIFLYFLATLVILYLLPGLHGIFYIGVPVYICVITAMVWRAIARLQYFEGLWSWSKLCTCAGSILFALSDLIIGIDRFRFNIEYSQVLIMSTYYAAQLGIALSIIDSKDNSVKDVTFHQH